MTITGGPPETQPGSVVPSMTTGSVMMDRVGLMTMVCTPLGGMLNLIVSGVRLTFAFAALMASRRVQSEPTSRALQNPSSWSALVLTVKSMSGALGASGAGAVVGATVGFAARTVIAAPVLLLDLSGSAIWLETAPFNFRRLCGLSICTRRDMPVRALGLRRRSAQR